MKIGYARISTVEQNLNLQTDALERAGCEKIFTDTASGSINARKGLIDAVEFCRNGDALVVWKLDRLGRSLKHLIDTVNYLQAKGVDSCLCRKASTLRRVAENLSFTSSAR